MGLKVKADTFHFFNKRSYISLAVSNIRILVMSKEHDNNSKRFIAVGALEHLKKINGRICSKQSSENHVTANTYCMRANF